MSDAFKATYLRLLSGQEPMPGDYWAARELIDNGHAHGRYQVSRPDGLHEEVVTVIGFAPTMQGRLYADDLAQAARRATWRYRLGRAAIGALTFGAGWVAGVLSKVSETALTHWLGVGG